MDRIVREQKIREEHDGEGWSERDALKHWAEICGLSPMTRYLHEFLLNEIALQDPTSIEVTQDTFVKLFSFLLRHKLPMELLQLPSFSASMRQSRNAEEALLAALNGCALRTCRISRIEHPDPIAFGAWLRRIQGQAGGDSLASRCLSYLNLANLHLIVSDLNLADLSHSDLSHSNISYSACFEARFDEAILIYTMVGRCYLGHASFQRAQILNSDLLESDLSWTHLEGAVIRDTRLKNLKLRYTYLDGVDADAAARRELKIRRSASPDKGKMKRTSRTA
jgi:uncharacterized protein YjbI with pentapeptide repeats